MTPEEARRVVEGRRDPAGIWAEDYPVEGDRLSSQAYLRACGAGPDPQPFGPYQIVRVADGRVVGGIGFKSLPERGRVEVGYGVVPSARGRGIASAALEALMDLARSLGVQVLWATTDPGNLASQRVLEKAGLKFGRDDGMLRWYERRLV